MDHLRDATRPLAQRITDLLRGDPDTAYSFTDIVQLIERYASDRQAVLALLAQRKHGGPGPLEAAYRTALRQLVEDGTVVAAEVQGDTYYGWGEAKR